MAIYENGSPMYRAKVGGKLVFKIKVDGNDVVSPKEYTSITDKYYLATGTGTVSGNEITVQKNKNMRMIFKNYGLGVIMNGLWGNTDTTSWGSKGQNPFYIYLRKTSDGSQVLKIQLEPHSIYLGTYYVRIKVAYALDNSGSTQYPLTNYYDTTMIRNASDFGFFYNYETKRMTVYAGTHSIDLGTWSNPETCELEITKNDDVYVSTSLYKVEIKSFNLLEGYKQLSNRYLNEF